MVATRLVAVACVSHLYTTAQTCQHSIPVLARKSFSGPHVCIMQLFVHGALAHDQSSAERAAWWLLCSPHVNKATGAKAVATPGHLDNVGRTHYHHAYGALGLRWLGSHHAEDCFVMRCFYPLCAPSLCKPTCSRVTSVEDDGGCTI